MQSVHYLATKQRSLAQDHYQNYYRGDAGNLEAQEGFRIWRSGQVSNLCLFLFFLPGRVTTVSLIIAAGSFFAAHEWRHYRGKPAVGPRGAVF